jgi:hypothetical protein
MGAATALNWRRIEPELDGSRCAPVLYPYKYEPKTLTTRWLQFFVQNPYKHLLTRSLSLAILRGIPGLAIQMT